MAEPPGEGGFFHDNYDLTKAKISQQHIAARLTTGPRDEDGRFRITKGMSSLVTPEELASASSGVTLMDPKKAVTLHTEKKRPADWKVDLGGADDKKKQRNTETEETEQPAVKPTWLAVGLVVKILDKSDAVAYKRKGVIRSVKQSAEVNTADVELLLGDDTKTTVTAREKHLETVLPAVGKPVRVVKGESAGEYGELRKLHQKRFLAEVAIDASDGVRQRVEFLQYDEVCKVNR